jgi:hypothetical protein
LIRLGGDLDVAEEAVQGLRAGARAGQQSKGSAGF